MVDIRWRQFMSLLGGAAAAWPLAARAADARPRLAFLTLSPQQSAHLAFIDGLRRLGYVQGRNLDIDHRYGDVERLKPLAQELIAFKPDILVADSPSAAIAFQSVAPTLPIVCLALTDANIPDLFASYARPGGNVTGMAQSVEGLTGKLVEVALEIIPGARRIGFLSNPNGASMRLFALSVDVAARARGMGGANRGGRCRRRTRFRFRSIRQARGAGRDRAGQRSVLFAGYADCATRARHAAADRRRRTPLHRGRLARILWHRPTRELSTRGQLCRPDSEGRQAG